MNKLVSLALGALLTPCAAWADCTQECTADSVDILAYSQLDGNGGLKIAVKCCQSGQWKPIGGGYTFVSSDFGPWGSHKKMFSPSLQQNADGSWTATWIADIEDAVLATAISPDLMSWLPQTYAVSAQPRTGIAQYSIDGRAVNGTVTRVPVQLVKNLTEYADSRNARWQKTNELMKDDPKRFADLGNLKYTLKADPKNAKDISDKLIGIFFEDINYGADGGLYAELIQNRDFEYLPSDNKDKWDATTAWSMPDKAKGSFGISTMNPIHPNNLHYLTVKTKEPGYRVINSGWDGIAVKGGEKYDFSAFVRSGSEAPMTVSLVTPQGKTLASARIVAGGQGWDKYEAVLTPTASCPDVNLTIAFEKPGIVVDLDMISLFPQDTFKGRKNGLRKDLAQTLADMHPRFMRFPGGCVAHGNGIDNIYDWKGSIGPLEARKPLSNIWSYHQTRGLGYFEYFLLCEDIGAEPLPVLAAGVPCQNSGKAAHHSHDAITSRGQQGGLPMEEMDAYIQDVLDLIEYANGDSTTTWGAKRAQAGHPEPFNLKYIGIGNEDMITDVFETRFKMIYDAVRSAHPEVEVVGTVGPFYEGSDYEAGWRLADELNIPLVDEHYYVAPGWMIYNQDYYDNYKRGPGATRVYLGEYAAHVPGRKSNMETALAEALYLTSVERNADIVEMTSYAPLLAKRGHTQWTPDLIYFDNIGVYPTTDYYTQLLYGQNSGSQYIPAAASLDTDNEKASVRVGSSILFDKASGDYIIKLVNILPVAVDADLDLSALKINAKAAPKALLFAGNPQDTKVKPEPIDLNLKSAKRFSYEMPPYSMTVIRLKKQ